MSKTTEEEIWRRRREQPHPPTPPNLMVSYTKEDEDVKA
jgi:hypothetical protein